MKDDGTPVTLASVQLDVAKAHTSLLADQAEWEKWRSRAQMLRAYARKRQQGLLESAAKVKPKTLTLTVTPNLPLTLALESAKKATFECCV